MRHIALNAPIGLVPFSWCGGHGSSNKMSDKSDQGSGALYCTGYSSLPRLHADELSRDARPFRRDLLWQSTRSTINKVVYTTQAKKEQSTRVSFFLFLPHASSLAISDVQGAQCRSFSLVRPNPYK